MSANSAIKRTSFHGRALYRAKTWICWLNFTRKTNKWRLLMPSMASRSGRATPPAPTQARIPRLLLHRASVPAWHGERAQETLLPQNGESEPEPIH